MMMVTIKLVGIMCVFAVFVELKPNDLCARVFCAIPECENSIQPKGQCCPGCTGKGDGCMHGENTYQDHQKFWDKCNRCTCKNGKVTCTEKACIDDQCKNNSGNLLNQTKEPCSTCTCLDDGSYTCNYILCALVYCEHGSIKKKNECCPTCRIKPVPDNNPNN